MLFLLTTLFFSTLALSTPLFQTRQESQSTNIYICGDAGFDNTHGTCHNYPVNASECFDLPQGASKQASSAGPDEGTFCVLYSERGCRGHSVPFTYPGISDFTKYKFDNMLSSVRCDFIWGWPKKSG